jgi:hypothetical protein
MIRCPQCHNDKEFAIDAVEFVAAYVTQITEADPFGEPGDLVIFETKPYASTEWDEDASCTCRRCQYTAALDTFAVSDTEP